MSDVALTAPAARLPRVSLHAALALALVVVSVASLGVGALEVPVRTVLAVLLGAIGVPAGEVPAVAETVVLSVRLPRVLHGVVLGAGLGAAGAVVQGWFRNPLADPGLIGVSAGASLAAAAWFVLGAAWLPGVPEAVALPAAAVLGALATTAAVIRLGGVAGRVHAVTVLLAGIAVTALCMAAVGVLVTMANDVALRNFTFWTMGSLGGATWARLAWMAPPILVALALTRTLIRPLDALLLGDATARALGVSPDRLGVRVALLGAVLVGVGVAACGQVGFVGLVAPHLIRLVTGPRHAHVVPGAALLGGLLVVGADTLARTAFAPVELPIGVVMAFLGAPVFLHLLPRAVRGLS